MTGDNKVLSDRQVFRTGVLENVSLAMMLAPYVAVKLAGDFHMLALFAGIVFSVLYGLYIYTISDRVNGSYEEMLLNKRGILGKIIGVIYYFRFYVRAALYIVFLGEIVSTYMLVNISIWIIIVSFALVCVYGSWKTITGRARMLEMLFLWMVVPLILMAVFSVNSVEVAGNKAFVIPIEGMEVNSILGVLLGGYGILLLLQGMELMLFTAGHARNNTKSNTLKVIIWINVTLFMAYIFIMGILGRRWVVKDVKASFNVMEAASFPGNAINRLDYLVLSFLMIGVFAAVSGYLFWGRRILECSNINAGSFWRITITIAVLVAMVVFFCVPVIRRILFMYVFLADFVVSILLSLVVFMPDK